MKDLDDNERYDREYYDGEFYIENFNEYIDFINKNYNKNTELWYRGQRDKNWGLTPGLYRNARLITKPGEIIQKLEFTYPNYKEGLNKFKELTILKEMIVEELDEVDIMLIAQHFGLITPLLDWTSNPLIALYFAIESWNTGDELPVVYILNPGKCNYWLGVRKQNGEDIEEPININEIGKDFITKSINKLDDIRNYLPLCFYNSKDYSFRITRQYGKFTLHSPLKLNYPWESTRVEGLFITKKLLINQREIPNMKRILNSLNINKKTVYGNYNSKLDIKTRKICEEIKTEFNIKNSIN